MQHEVLLALSGYPGNIFTVCRETGLFEVTADLPFIHPSEVSLLNRICRLGTYYSQLKRFIADQNTASVTLTPQPKDGRSAASGLYLKALGCGIDSVLETYRQKLVTVEQKCISDPRLPLSHLQHEFEEYQFLLPSLDACVKHIHRNKLHGCQVLSHLREQCSTGILIVQKAFERVLAMCHSVLYKQLSAWMLHGLLLDEQGEFFIEAVKEGTGPQTEGDQPGVGGRETIEEREEGQPDSVSAGYKSAFRINHALSPSYIPLRVIEKILFVGKAVQIFQSQAHGHQKLPTTLTGAGSKLRSDQFRFGHMLAELERQPVFQLREFETTIDSIRDCVAEHLWKLLVEESDLVGHLQTVKNFFLLGRGELYLAFVDLAQAFMTLPPTATTEHDVNVAFQQAMVKIGMENEDLMKQFKLTVTLPQQEDKKLLGSSRPTTKRKGEGAWNHLGLSHSVSWPLHILFTPTILEKYNLLFKFLLALRRAQMALQQSWAHLMQFRNRAGELRAIWELRTHMGFLVDNLQYYVQVDVLETQFSLLLDKVSSTHDFETIQHAHENFVTSLQSQLFLLLPAVSHCLSEILELCNSFSSLLHQRDDLTLSADDRATVDRIAKDFKRQSSLFFKIISSIKSHHSSPHLAQLLLRVDYNKYFSTQNPLVSTTLL